MDPLRDLVRRYLADEPYRRLTDDELWARFRDHREEGAFRVVLERTGGRIYARCRAILRVEADAEEAFQEAFCALFKHRAKLPTYRATVAWLYQAATNAARMQRRRQWRSLLRDWRKAAATPVSFEAVDNVTQQEQRWEVVAALAGLPERERRVVELVYLEGMTHAEAADALGWPRSSIGPYVRRGLDRLLLALKRRGVAVAGLVAIEAVLRAGDRVLDSDRLTALADGVMMRTRTAAALAQQMTGAMKLAVVLGLGAVSAAAGVAVLEHRGGPNGPPRATSTPPAPVEPVPDRNLRLFRAEVAPRVTAAFRELVIGSGEVVLESAEAFDTRVDCTLALKHRPAPGGDGTTRVRIIHEVDGGGTWVMADPYGRGDWRVIDQGQPIVLWRIPLTGQEWVVRLAALERAVDAFRVLPRDERTASEKAADEGRLLAAFRPYVGVWYRRGDPARRCEIKYGAGGVVMTRDGGTEVNGLWRFRLMPDGSLRGLFAFHDEARFSPDGRRIDFSRTGDWWSRQPVTATGM